MIDVVTDGFGQPILDKRPLPEVERLTMEQVPAERRAELWSELCRSLSYDLGWKVDVDRVTWGRRVHRSGVVWWELRAEAGYGASVPDPSSCGEDTHFRRWAKMTRGRLVGGTPYEYGTEANPVRFDG